MLQITRNDQKSLQSVEQYKLLNEWVLKWGHIHGDLLQEDKQTAFEVRNATKVGDTLPEIVKHLTGITTNSITVVITGYDEEFGYEIEVFVGNGLKSLDISTTSPTFTSSIFRKFGAMAPRPSVV